VQLLRLKTPYPYFTVLLVAFIIWAIGPGRTRADYSNLKWTIELDRELNVPEQNIWQHSLSLVVENTGKSPANEIPIELSAKIEPVQRADIMAGFLGRKLMIMQQGRSLPLVLVLAGEVAPGHKKRFYLEGSIEAAPPFKVTYEVREDDEETVLAQYVVEPK